MPERPPLGVPQQEELALVYLPITPELVDQGRQWARRVTNEWDMPGICGDIDFVVAELLDAAVHREGRFTGGGPHWPLVSDEALPGGVKLELAALPPDQIKVLVWDTREPTSRPIAGPSVVIQRGCARTSVYEPTTGGVTTYAVLATTTGSGTAPKCLLSLENPDTEGVDDA